MEVVAEAANAAAIPGCRFGRHALHDNIDLESVAGVNRTAGVNRSHRGSGVAVCVQIDSDADRRLLLQGKGGGSAENQRYHRPDNNRADQVSSVIVYSLRRARAYTTL